MIPVYTECSNIPFSICYPEVITEQNNAFTSVIFPPTDDGQMKVWSESKRERQTDVMLICTFLPQLAETPVKQSQDKANEYGLDRLQYGWLEGREGGREEENRDKKTSASKSTKT